jgi:hypothetical protein
MADPLELDTILAEFSEEDPAWVLRDAGSGKYVTIPHAKYPGRNIFHFFMSELDCKRILEALALEAPALRGRKIQVTEIKLKQAIRGVAGSGNPADGFVVHTPNEVFEYLWDKA